MATHEDPRGDGTPEERTAPGAAAAAPPGDLVEELFPAASDRLLAGRYEVVGQLGKGAFGLVLRARDRVTDTMVAIKVMLQARARTEAAIARMRREVQAAWRVTHPNVVRIHDLIVLGDRLALSMELVEGETLEQTLARQGRLERDRIALLAGDLASALAAAHRAGVVHRDLKPTNIILRASDGHALVTDFGVSRTSDGEGDGELLVTSLDNRAISVTRSGELLGTPIYMAPEQLLGRRDVGPAADVYAFGLVLFEAATGSRPHVEESLDRLREVRTARPPPRLSGLRPDLPPGLCAVVDRCLLPTPEERIADGRELLAALEPLVGARDRIGRPRSSSPGRGLKSLLIGVGLVTIVLGAGLVLRRQGLLPAHDRRVLVSVDTSELGESKERLAAAITAMTTYRLRADRRITVVPGAEQANVRLRLTVHPRADQVELTAALGARPERLGVVGSATASSVAEALDGLLAQLRPHLDKGQAERPADAGERAQMAKLGARDLLAYREYQRCVDELLRTVSIDAPGLIERTKRLIERDPGWMRPYVVLATLYGMGSSELPGLVARARAAVTPGRDPAGELMLSAAPVTDVDLMATLATALDVEVRANPDDVLAVSMLMQLLLPLHRSDEIISILRDANERRPDLQFGTDLEQIYRQQGRSSEISALQARWLTRAPDSEQARSADVAVAIAEGRTADAERGVRELMLLFGETPLRLSLLGEVQLISGHLAQAGEVVARLLRGDQFAQAHAWLLQGQIAVLQGRLGAAHEALSTAVREGRRFGQQGPYQFSVEELAALTTVLGDTDSERRVYSDLERVFIDSGYAGRAAAIRLKLDKLEAPRQCPDVHAALAPLADDSTLLYAKRSVWRMAAAIGCATCSEAVALGLSPWENSVALLYEFARCAEKSGRNELAADVYTRVAYIRTMGIHSAESPALVFSVLARYHLGIVFARLGRDAEARRELERFMELWGHVDRPLVEVDEARRLLASLPKAPPTR